MEAYISCKRAYYYHAVYKRMHEEVIFVR